MRLGQTGFSCWGSIFAILESTQYPALIILSTLSFLLSTCNRNTYFQTILSVRQYFSEKKRPVVIEQTRFLGTVFFCSEFKLEHTVFPLG